MGCARLVASLLRNSLVLHDINCSLARWMKLGFKVFKCKQSKVRRISKIKKCMLCQAIEQKYEWI